MIIQRIKFSSRYTEEEVMRIAKEREPQFQAIPGLIQKYYVKYSEDTYGGIYLWESKAHLHEYKGSELAASIPEAYGIMGIPDVEISDLLFSLK